MEEAFGGVIVGVGAALLGRALASKLSETFSVSKQFIQGTVVDGSLFRYLRVVFYSPQFPAFYPGQKVSHLEYLPLKCFSKELNVWLDAR